MTGFLKLCCAYVTTFCNLVVFLVICSPFAWVWQVVYV